MDQENRPPSAMLGVKEVRTPAPSPPRPGHGQQPGHPVRNTFIHYGTPLRAGTRALASPKTVPPNFAPEVQEGLTIEAAWTTQQRQQPTVPEWPPVARPSATYFSTVERLPLAVEAPNLRGAGIAPLRLFDFLPSPKVQPVQGTAVMPQLQGQMPPMPVAGMPAMQVAPTPQMAFGTAFEGAAPQLWHQDVGRMPQPMPAPYGAVQEVLSSQGFQPAPPWASWGTVDYSFSSVGLPPPPSMPAGSLPMQAAPAPPASMPSAPPLCPPSIGVLQPGLQTPAPSYSMPAPLPPNRAPGMEVPYMNSKMPMHQQQSLQMHQ